MAARDFLPLFNDFYADTNYSIFFNSHIPYFEEATEKFINETYGAIDFEWFKKYVDPSNLRCIYSLSSGNYAATVNNEKMPYYSNGWTMANEYITRAYDILYKVQHDENLEECILREKDFQFKDSFKYIENVYNMILELGK